MKTLISKIDIKNIDIEELKKQAKLLEEGKTVIFPTETVYGLGANALDEEAVKKIYKAKGRPSDNPLIVHIANKEKVYDLAENISEKAQKVMDKFWPGPITLVFNKKDIVPLTTSGGLDTVAIRMPSHKIARKIIELSNVVVAAPSANISGRPSPTKANHVHKEMDGRVNGIVLGNDCSYGLESTVLDMTQETPMILRPGSITKEDLEMLIGQIDVDPSLLKKEDNKKAKAPGMKYTHYSPNATVYIVTGEKEKVIQKINELIEDNNSKNLKTGVMCIKENENKYNDITISLGNTMEEIGHNLFDTLIQMDDKNVDVVYSEDFGNVGLGSAIMNRLIKSAGYKIIQA